MILIPKNENRKFKYGILPNKLKYTIIFDAETDTTNVSVCIKTGTLNDPKEYMGLAHFLEHMLFLGSAKYKEESYFDMKLKMYGGHTNAYTSSYETVYYFSVLSTAIEEIIDIFSRFFIDPLFDISSVSREINAINSEHLKNLNSEFWRLRQFIYNLSKPDSIINHFGTGSHETLNMSIDILRNKMIEFYNTYYNSDNMCLTILSNKPISMIEKLIVNSFGNLSQGTGNLSNSKRIDYDIFIPKFNIKLKEYNIEPVSEQNFILYFWDMPPLLHYTYDMLINIINEIINLNSYNNLLNILIEKNMATSINTHFLEEGVYILLVNVSKNVVYKKAIVDINNIVREYFNNLNKLDWTKIYKYMIDKYKLNYNYSMKDDNLEITKTISVNMHYYKEKNVYNGTKIILQKNFDKIFTTLKYLTFDKVNIIYGTKDKLCNVKMKKGKYYNYLYCMLNTTYILKSHIIALQKIDLKSHISIDITNSAKDDISKIKPINIPNLDKFNIPKEIKKHLWYGGVSRFNEPYVRADIYINNIKTYNTIKSTLITEIALNIINHYIDLIFFKEKSIGYIIFITRYINDGVIAIVINGFNYNFVDFFNNTLNSISMIRPSDNIVQSYILQLKESLINTKIISPWAFSDMMLLEMINRYAFNYIEKLKVLNSISINDIKKRVRRIVKLSRVPIKTVIYGNIQSNVLSKLNITSNLIKLDKDYILPKINNPTNLTITNLTIMHPNKKEVNKCIAYILPFKNLLNKYNPHLVAMILILSNMLEQPVYSELRTKAQLGYLVKSYITSFNTIDYMIVIKIQSALNINLVETKINEFLIYFSKYINNYDSIKFNNIKKSIYDSLNMKYNNMDDMTQEYLPEIRKNMYIFNRKELISNEINKIKLNDIITLYHSIIKNKKILKII